MPMNPSDLTNKSEVVAELMLRAGVTPVALETLTDKTADGLDDAMPTLPAPSMVNLVLVPSAVEEAILNLLASAVSMPMVQAESPLPVVNPRAGVVALKIESELFGVVVPMPTLPPKLTIPVPCWVIVLWKVAAPPKLEVPETVRLVELAAPDV